GGFQSETPYGSIIISEKAVQSDIGKIEGSNFTENMLFNFGDNVNQGESSKNLKQEMAKLNEFNIVVSEEIVAILQAFLNQFIYLMQGFLSFGLLVGLAGIGVIMTRSVTE